MEMIVLLSCSLAVLMTADVRGAAVEAPLDVITLDDLSQGDREFLAYLEEESIRKKRSDDILSLLKTKIGQGIKSKIGDIASASSHLSSGKGKDYHNYGPPEESYDEKSFDFWDLQKSILYTLGQAVKAIKGGFLTVKGHLIKGSGYIISAKGKLISAKGEAITNMGKHIASSALLSPRPAGHSGHSAQSEHSGPGPEYIPPSSSGFSAPSSHASSALLRPRPSGHSGHSAQSEHSGPGPAYIPPSSSGFSAPSSHGMEYHPEHHGPPHGSYSDHKFPHSYEAYKDHLPRGTHHGILVLKKIPKGHKDKHNGNDGLHIPSDKHKPDLKPEEPSAPSYSFLPDFKSIFSASSHKEHEEIPSSAHPHSEHETALPHYESPPTHYEPSPTPHETSNSHNGQPTHYEPSPTLGEPTPTHHNQQFNHYGSPNANFPAHQLNPPASSYGTPIEIPENNFQDYFKDFNNLQLSQSSNGLHSTALLPNMQAQLPNLEIYDPLKLPSYENPTPLTASLSNTVPHQIPQNLRGLEHFPSYPVELSNNFGAKHNNPFQYSVKEPDSDFSASQHEFVIPGLTSSRGAKHSHKFPDSLIINPDILTKYLLAHNNIQNKHSSHTRTVSRQKRPKRYDLARSYRLGPNRFVKI